MCRLMMSPLIASVLLLTSVWQPVRGDDLLQLVHRDAAFCLHVPRPVADWQRIQSSKFADRITASPLFREWQDSPEFQNLAGVRSMVERVLGKPLSQAAQQLFGAGFVFAGYVVPGGKPDGVLLQEADSEASIRDLVAKLSQLADPKTEELTHRDTVYERWTTKDGKTVHFVTLGKVLAVAESQALIQQVIDLRLDDQLESSLAGREELIKATKRRTDSEVAAVYLSPRAWDSHVTADPESPQPLKDAWKHCRWVTMRLRYDDAPQFDVEADYDSTDTPESWTRWTDLASSSELPVERIPDNVLLAMSGLLDSPGIADLTQNAQPVDAELPKEIRQARRMLSGLLLGLDPVNDLLPVLGPRWMAYVVPREFDADSAAVSKSFPVDMLFAIELQRDDSAPNADSDPIAALHNALGTGLNVLAAVHNTRTTRQIAVVRQKSVGDATIRWAEPVAVFRPAYAIADGYLLLASSPELCEQFLAKSARRGGLGAEFRNTLQFVVASSPAARKLLSTHEAWFMWRASKDKVTADEAARRLQRLDGFLQMLDTVWLSTSLDKDLIRLTAGVSVSGDPAADGK
jgi:hypothetical protein